MNSIALKAISLNPSVMEYLSLKNRLAARKAVPVSRDEQERRLTRAIYAVDKRYLAILTENNGQVPYDFWQKYEQDLSDSAASIIRSYIEQSFAESNEYTSIIDKTEAVSKIDAAVTATILLIIKRVVDNTRNQYLALLQEGVTGIALIERLALRFGSGHAETIAITELTRAEGEFADTLADMLRELGLSTQIRLNTSEDERVCPICGPADHKLKDQPINTSTGGWNGQTWGQRFGKVPFHVNCRCKENVEIKR